MSWFTEIRNCSQKQLFCENPGSEDMVKAICISKRYECYECLRERINRCKGIKVANPETCSGTIGCAKQLQCCTSVQPKWIIDRKVLLRPFCGII